MVTPDFVHIHNHTQYSKFDGLSPISDTKKDGGTKHSGNAKRDGEPVLGIVSTAKAMGMKHVGLTDHGTFAGAIAFLQECRKQDIKPVLGMEAYQARDHRVKSKNDEETKDGEPLSGQTDGRKGNRHINIIAKDYAGFKNVSALSQRASLEGYYYDKGIPYRGGHMGAVWDHSGHPWEVLIRRPPRAPILRRMPPFKP